MANKVKIAALQMCSGLDYQENLKKIETFLSEAKNKNVEAVFLPECFYSMSDGVKPTPYLVEESNEHFSLISQLARKFQIALLGGSVAYSFEGKVINRCLNFDATGKLIDYYDKMHLFSCEIASNDGSVKKIDEGDIYTSGTELRSFSYGDLKIGPTICFDIRYPWVYQKYINQGVNLISISSAFTVPTGKAHWETLVRARAIECQCFVVAAAQWGRNNDRIQTYGHSLIVDPWGNILGNGEEGEKLIYSDIDLTLINKTRLMVKVYK